MRAVPSDRGAKPHEEAAREASVVQDHHRVFTQDTWIEIQPSLPFFL